MIPRLGAPRLPDLNRRRFITAALAAMPLLCRPASALAALSPVQGEKRLRLLNPKTEEVLETVFWADGDYVPEALKEIDHLMRDLRSGQCHHMDRRLIELLYRIQDRLELKTPLHVISGYRSRQTNEGLRKQGWAAAKNSYHIRGEAVDIRHGDVTAALLRKTAFNLKQGGVGYYPRLNFIHLDTGPVRFWRKG
jgi:uncharacterized protein YcbK (DUF882 family)